MRNLKRIFAVALVLVISLSVAACHPKNEVAVTIGDVEFTSAYYMCALVNADSEAKTKVREGLSEDETTDKIDYYSKKVENTDYVKWVKDKAMETLKEIAAYKTLCKENKLEIPEEDANNAKTYSDYYWTNYGYSSYFEPNGVGAETYKQYMLDSYYSSVYFDHLYAKDGKEEIAADTVKEKMYGNFIIADMLQANFSNSTDEEKTQTKEKFNKYVADLTAGTKTFEEVYKEHNGSTEENETAESTEPKPKDKYASVLGAKDTAYESDQYDKVKDMAVGEVKLIELEDNAGLVIAVKQDIKADPYYLDTLDSATRHLIKDDDFKKDIKDYAGKMKSDINKYAVDRFNVKKIKEPTPAN